MKRTILITAIATVALGVSARADLDLPDVSQHAVIKQRIGLTDVKVTYHRPLVNGRKIWGGLVPLGEVWRAGANENTVVEVSDPVSVEGQPLPKGTYGLHMIPTADTWTVIFSKMAIAWGSYTYNQAEDALRVTVKPRPNEMEEALEYEFEDVKPDSATVTLKWAKRSIQIEERFENLSTKADLLKASGKPDEAKTVWNHALEITGARQLYVYGRGLQSEKRDAEAMEIFKVVVKRFPDHLFGHLSQARIKSAAGDFAGALEEAKKAQGLAPGEDQKKSIQGLIDKLQAKQDINK